MQVKWLRRGLSNRLKVFALGWAADESMIMKVDTDCDVMCVYDYRTIEPLLKPGDYQEISLVAWSYGVWAAEKIFRGWNFVQTIAVNGTPMPVDDCYGISRRVFDLTVRGIEKAGLEKFTQRMCDSIETIVIIKRDKGECVEELKMLGESFEEGYKCVLKWNKAIVGGRDLIFTPEVQMKYWNDFDVEVEYVEQMPHFPFGILT